MTITIEKNKEIVVFKGKVNELMKFVEGHFVPLTKIKMNDDGTAECRLHKGSELTKALEMEYLDLMDDKLFDILVGYNDLLSIGVDFNKLEHTELILYVRENLVEILKEDARLQKMIN